LLWRPDTITNLTHPSTAPKVPVWHALLGLALFAAAVFVLHLLLGKYHWSDVLERVRAISDTKLLRAAFFSFAGYSCLTLYDLLAVRFAGSDIPYPRVALISFMGYAIGHNVGLNSISGGAVRYRAYTALGLSAKQIATIIAFGTLTFFLGAGVLLGTSLISNAEMSSSVLHVPPWVALGAGFLLFAAVGAYLWLVCTRHGPLRFRKIEIPVPKPRVAFAQIGISCVDMLCASSVMYVLLPREAAMSFGAFAGIYLIALAAGALVVQVVALGRIPWIAPTLAITFGLWLVLRSHSAALCSDTAERCREPGKSGVVTVCSGSPDAGWGPSSTASG